MQLKKKKVRKYNQIHFNHFIVEKKKMIHRLIMNVLDTTFSNLTFYDLLLTSNVI